jgi:hypothetical protein
MTLIDLGKRSAIESPKRACFKRNCASFDTSLGTVRQASLVRAQAHIAAMRSARIDSFLPEPIE